MTMNDEGAGKTECFLGISDPFRLLLTQRITRPGLEPTAENAGETALSEMPGAQAGAIESDSDLQGLIRAWPELSAGARQKILRIVRTEGGKR